MQSLYAFQHRELTKGQGIWVMLFVVYQLSRIQGHRRPQAAQFHAGDEATSNEDAHREDGS